MTGKEFYEILLSIVGITGLAALGIILLLFAGIFF
ncbi:MAG: hypothetical protein Lokiarch_06400 [Candidatus Lokiarchaeum sp. GC14_75]|nr:MAG: hypothetical protein Lokiarch_06400 [Candidatus Lokiarchaeum sp. GC14_75]